MPSLESGPYDIQSICYCKQNIDVGPVFLTFESENYQRSHILHKNSPSVFYSRRLGSDQSKVLEFRCAVFKKHSQDRDVLSGR